MCIYFSIRTFLLHRLRPRAIRHRSILTKALFFRLIIIVFVLICLAILMLKISLKSTYFAVVFGMGIGTAIAGAWNCFMGLLIAKGLHESRCVTGCCMSYMFLSSLVELGLIIASCLFVIDLFGKQAVPLAVVVVVALMLLIASVIQLILNVIINGLIVYHMCSNDGTDSRRVIYPNMRRGKRLPATVIRITTQLEPPRPPIGFVPSGSAGLREV